MSAHSRSARRKPRRHVVGAFASLHAHQLIALTVALLCASTVLASPAEASSQRDSQYAYRQVWPAAVRLLRVDLGHDILEKDSEAGYVLFEAREEGKTFRGSLELVRLEGEGQKRVRIIVRIADRPSYVELGLLDRLERKLRDEYGPPPRSRPKSDSSEKSPDMDSRQ